MSHPPQRPLDRPPPTLVDGGVEEGHDVALAEDPVHSNELTERRQDLGTDATSALTRANAHSEARQAHQSRIRQGYRHLHIMPLTR